MTHDVVVIGGAGYVGMQLCRELKRRGHDVVAVARSNGKMLLERFGIPAVAPTDVTGLRGAPTIVNVAFPSLDRPERMFDLNRSLLKMISGLAAAETRLIHISTLAVFGFALDVPQSAGPIRMRRDYPYVEVKLDMERRVWRAWRSRGVQIVRLGNVWGPASPHWTASLADALMFGEPVGVAGYDGYCNITDVQNVASYLTFLAEQRGPIEPRFHHLAEFSGLCWSYWLNRLAARLKVSPVMAEQRGHYPTSLAAEFWRALATHSPRVFSRQLRAGRFTGSLRRAGLARVADGIRRAVVGRPRLPPWPRVDPPADPIFLEIMSSERRFDSVLADGWSPPLDSAASWSAVESWLSSAGYA